MNQVQRSYSFFSARSVAVRSVAARSVAAGIIGGLATLALVLGGCSAGTTYSEDVARQDSQWLVVDLRTGEQRFLADIPANAAPGGADSDHLLTLRRVPVHASTIGSPTGTLLADSDEMPQRTVDVSGYFVAITELTQSQWLVLAGDAPWSAFSEVAPGASLPATGMSYQRAVTVLADATTRLGMKFAVPTSDEWEDCARAGSTSASAFEPTDVAARNARAWVIENQTPGSGMHAVAQRDPNTWGLYDVQGNVWEMTSVRADESIGQVRGGSFADTAGSARFGNRSNLPIAMGHPNVGLRLVIIP